MACSSRANTASHSPLGSTGGHELVVPGVRAGMTVRRVYRSADILESRIQAEEELEGM